MGGNAQEFCLLCGARTLAPALSGPQREPSNASTHIAWRPARKRPDKKPRGTTRSAQRLCSLLKFLLGDRGIHATPASYFVTSLRNAIRSQLRYFLTEKYGCLRIVVIPTARAVSALSIQRHGSFSRTEAVEVNLR